MLYGTTKEFLDFFSFGDLRELPTLREYSELTAESRQLMSDRLGIAAARVRVRARAPSPSSIPISISHIDRDPPVAAADASPIDPE